MASFGRSHQLVRGRGWHVFGTLVLAWLILLAVNLILGLIFAVLPDALGRGLSSVISGTLIAPFIALVVTLVYYRLSATSQVPAAPGENYGGFGQTPLPRDPDYAGRPADDLSPAGRSALTGPRRPRRAGEKDTGPNGLPVTPGPQPPPSAAPGAAPDPWRARPGRTAARRRR
jgi:hypothetical protein